MMLHYFTMIDIKMNYKVASLGMKMLHKVRITIQSISVKLDSAACGRSSCAELERIKKVLINASQFKHIQQQGPS